MTPRTYTNYNYWIKESDELIRNNQKRDALFCVNKAIEFSTTETEHAEALIKKANLLFDLERYEEAIFLYNDIIQKFDNTTNPVLTNCLVQAQERKKQLNKTKTTDNTQNIENRSSPEKEDVLLIEVANILKKIRALHSLEEKLPLYDKILQKVGNAQDFILKKCIALALYKKGTSLAWLNRHEERLHIYDEIIQKFSNEQNIIFKQYVALALFYKSILLYTLGRYEEELPIYNEIIQKFGNEQDTTLKQYVAKALLEKGFVLSLFGCHEEELPIYDEIIQKFSDEQDTTLKQYVADALVEKADALLMLNRYEETSLTYDKILSLLGREPLRISEQISKTRKNKQALPLSKDFQKTLREIQASQQNDLAKEVHIPREYEIDPSSSNILQKWNNRVISIEKLINEIKTVLENTLTKEQNKKIQEGLNELTQAFAFLQKKLSDKPKMSELVNGAIDPLHRIKVAYTQLLLILDILLTQSEQRTEQDSKTAKELLKKAKNQLQNAGQNAVDAITPLADILKYLKSQKLDSESRNLTLQNIKYPLQNIDNKIWVENVLFTILDVTKDLICKPYQTLQDYTIALINHNENSLPPKTTSFIIGLPDLRIYQETVLALKKSPYKQYWEKGASFKKENNETQKIENALNKFIHALLHITNHIIKHAVAYAETHIKNSFIEYTNRVLDQITIDCAQLYWEDFSGLQVTFQKNISYPDFKNKPLTSNNNVTSYQNNANTINFHSLPNLFKLLLNENNIDNTLNNIVTYTAALVTTFSTEIRNMISNNIQQYSTAIDKSSTNLTQQSQKELMKIQMCKKNISQKLTTYTSTTLKKIK